LILFLLQQSTCFYSFCSHFSRRSPVPRLKRKDRSNTVEPPLLQSPLEPVIFTFIQNASIDYKISLRSDVNRFYYEVDKGSNKTIIIDLFTTVHVGERQYYDTLVKQLQDYDVVLYELITSKEYIHTHPESPWIRQLIQPLYSKLTEKLAEQFRWNHQMVLPMTKEGWYIADLDSETIQRLESANLMKIQRDYWWSILAGRSFSQRFLTKFMISDQSFVSFLRFLTWLTPCPEINALLIDWARMQPRAGGISPFILPILHKLSKFQYLDASRLAFTQQLLSGLADAGSWGGEAQSDIAVRITARNQECCRTLRFFLSNLPNKNISSAHPTMKVAVLYGAYHIQDLKRRFVEELRMKMDLKYKKSLTVWSISSLGTEDLDLNGEVQWTQGKQDLLLKLLDFSTTTILAISALAYVALGVIDWWIGLELILKNFEHILSVTEEIQDKIVFSSATLAYIVLYVQRHLYFLRKISYVGIQWDRGLFADV